MWEEGGGGGGGGDGGGGAGGALGLVTGAGGRGGKEAREAYLVQFPRDEEDEGEMEDDEDGEGSLSGEGEENANIKEEVREMGFLGGGESGTASPCCSAASCRPSRNVDGEIMRRGDERFACISPPTNHSRDVGDKENAAGLIFFLSC